MMANHADDLEEVRMSNVMNEDFMTIVCFSILGILRYPNMIEIVMNDPIFKRGDFIDKLTTIEQQHKATDERPSKLHSAMQALDKRKRKKKKGIYFSCGKKRHFTKECQLKPRRTPKERANKVIGGRKEFVFTTQLGKS